MATLITVAWAAWGSIENFFEGWYYPSLLQNLGLMLLQYLSPMLISMAVSLAGLRWPRLGGSLYALIGVAFGSWIILHRLGHLGSLLTWVPVLIPLPIIGLLFWFGRPRPRRLAYAVAAGLPLLVALGAGAPGAISVAQRVNDGNFGARVVVGNGVTLVWAPQGPGWPLAKGATWNQAEEACAHLAADGTATSATPQHIWRLPTVDEAVRSLTLHGRNAGGVWSATTQTASYKMQPDKETPLWNPTSQVIYWWTGTGVSGQDAYRLTYNGEVLAWPKQENPTYLAFRCIKSPPAT